MPKRKRTPKKGALPSDAKIAVTVDASEDYAKIMQLALDGELQQAKLRYKDLAARTPDPKFEAVLLNDIAAIAAIEGNFEEARDGLERAAALDPKCAAVLENLKLLPPRVPQLPSLATTDTPVAAETGPRPIRVAILSFLFNWPSTGGGIVHTVELAKFLSQAGYTVRHIYAEYLEFGVGKVGERLPYDSQSIRFDESTWQRATIQSRFREAVGAFEPDYVVITDSWNFKPLLAEAVKPYPTILRFQAMECLCPLNNVRLLFDGPDQVRQCQFHQLATPGECHRCLETRQHMSGQLHRTERALSGVGSPEYDKTLREAVRDARAVLVVNPLQQAMFAPYARDVRVIPSGFDPARFAWPRPERKQAEPTKIFCAALVHEPMKGFPILHDAARRLWGKRKDFQLVVTGDPPGRVDEFTQFVGWQSQDDLPRHFAESDICVVPTIAQEALGRTAVEAMASGIPVVASNLGGLPFTVTDGLTGLLVEPGNPADLAEKLETLLDDPALRRRMGDAGRKRFEESFTWNSIIDRQYRPLLSERFEARKPAVLQTSSDSSLKALRTQHPWPTRCPHVPIPRENLGWFEDGAREALASSLHSDVRVVLEMGTWLGLSTRYISDRAPQATVVTIDHFEGSPEHQGRPEWRNMLPLLFETFVALSWSYRDRIVPLRMKSIEGLHVVKRHGIEPDVLFFDADHRFEAVSQELKTAKELFPRALLVGDDYDDPDVQRAVTEFAQSQRLKIETYGRRWRAWTLRPMA